MKNLLVLVCLLPLFGGHAQAWDINSVDKINSWDRGFVREYSKGASRTTPYLVVGIPAAMAIYGGITKNEPLFKDALYIGTSVIEAVALTYSIKFMTDRRRPYEKYPDRIDPSSKESDSSFPSSHTSAAFSLATSLSIKYPKWYVIAPSFTWACSVGFARMNEGVHYPSDVIGGALIGSGCAVANIYVNRWLIKRFYPKKKIPAPLLGY